jgi:hypothetical protein
MAEIHDYDTFCICKLSYFLLHGIQTLAITSFTPNISYTGSGNVYSRSTFVAYLACHVTTYTAGNKKDREQESVSLPETGQSSIGPCGELDLTAIFIAEDWKD